LKQIKLEHFKEVLNILEEVFRELNVDFYIIGAIAKEYWYQRGNKRMRQTKDVDFAVLVASREVYEAVRERLRGHQFADTRENAFVMISPQGVQVDLLPFGDIAIDDNVQLTGEGMIKIRVNGFMEVYETGVTEVEMETGHVFKAATLPAITLLKLIAYDDRPEKRQKDARDIAGIIQHFFDLEADLIYEHHNDLFREEEPERELQEIAAIVIGREMKKMCGDNKKLKDRLISILTTQIEKEQVSAFVQQMVGETKLTVKDVVGWLAHLRQGVSSQ
jgi:predicted nucleotidyltransferase